MSDDAERWKEKYLKGIEQQDRLEKRWQARLDLLRRGLVRSSLAAEGSDRAVDECMKEMREIVRKDDMDAGLAGLIPRLEKAVLDSEQRREVRAGQVSTALTALVAQLQSLPLPREVRKPLKRFAKELEDRASQARELPLLLSELSGLQGRALNALEKTDQPARPGLLERLFGGRDEAGAPETSQPDTPGQPAALPATSPAPDADADDDLDEAPVAPAPPAPAKAEPQAAAVAPQTPAAEPAGSARAAPEPGARPAEAAAVVAPTPSSADPAAPAPAEAALADDAVAVAALVKAEPEVTPLTPVQPVSAPIEGLLAPVPIVPFEQVVPFAPLASADVPDEPQAEAGEEGQAGEEGEYALPHSSEPSYSSVAAHIEDTLLGLLDDLNLPDIHRPHVESMRERLEHGLNWYELLPILDDLAVLMLAISDSGQVEFETYLKQLNQRLESFQSSLQAVNDGHSHGHSSARAFDSELREHVDDLQSSVQEASDLVSLKGILEKRLEGMLGAMDDYQRKRDEREREVAESLQHLASRVASMEQEALGVRASLEEQRRKALLDPLTGLPNRAAWGERLEREMAHRQEQASSLLIGILDLDHFKRINDGYGHLAGDKVLKIVANQLQKRLRTTDFMARFGGEEFVMLMPATTVATGLQRLEEMRAAVEQCPFHFKGEPVTITVSIGMTALRPAERSDTALKRADQALYRAKEAGRNRVEQG
ncbi:GGDEF domain-containing protein [Pseudomonas sp. DTU_2021_1001937_2_SI_NGA_ILE_001]|uniref:GGDEF domain-containing protein n=1 Tax=Pseudomonas sp. DTU_2021_1001937_2_SI_NGA_ILE_001 TaxID=3077589 RepID=UPI0028FC27D7|nr:GGDEF domain-containing protein [Pseudomonas sp. DTU_2021_1001937_2_SI_NGA_ILE_001]WNW12676.1 GGDEF domain-containing protein [Pseudomonas sp. DTU_2021_1001937_2_SI_NGA_ILE_001]